MKKTTVLIGLFLFGASVGKAEAINPMPPVTYDPQGAAQEPASVRTALTSGSVPPGIQLVLQQHLIDQCVAKVLSEGPTQRTSYKTANQQFTDANCTLARCFQRGLMLDFLAQSSPNPKNGGTTNVYEQQMYQNVAKILEQQLSKAACGPVPTP